MNHAPKEVQTGPKAGLATVGLGVFAVVCCAGAPLIAGALGSIAVGGLFGAGAGVLTVRDTVAQFPTFTEAYLKGVESLEP